MAWRFGNVPSRRGENSKAAMGKQAYRRPHRYIIAQTTGFPKPGEPKP